MRWFYDLKTMQKLAVSFGMMIAALCGVAYLGMHAAEDARQSWELAFKRDLQGLDAARRVDIARLNAARHFRAAMLLRDESKKAELVRHIDEADAEMRAALDEVDAKSVLPETHRRTADVRRLLPDFTAQAKEAARLSSIDMGKALEAHAHATELGNRIGEDTTWIANGKKDLAGTNFKEGVAAFERSRELVVAITIGAVALGVLLAFMVGRIISRPLAKAVAILDRVAAGDLSQNLDVHTKDEVGMMAEALNRSVSSMRTTLASVTEVAMEVSSASTQLAAGAEQISSGAQEQAASLEETAASLEEISSTVKQNADNAQQAAQLASGARDAAERGGQVVESAVEAMTEITTSSKRIADIITTIDEIAFQTNLLALNAAVEAARAGEQGRGFGVVAAEVRTLAQRTASAAREIRGLIADASSKVEVGTTQVNQSGETLTEIVRSVKRVTDMIAEIAAASREQTSGIDQVNTAVTQVDQVTQANASQTEELSATATSLRDKSTYLRELVSAFNLGHEGGAARMEPARRVSPPPIPKAANSNARLPSAKHSIQRVPAAAPPPMQRASGFEEF